MSTQSVGRLLTTRRIAVLALTVALVGALALGSLPFGILDGGGESVDAVAAEETQPQTVVSLVAADDTVTLGETTTYDIVVETANGGIGAYDISVSVDDPGVAAITDVSSEATSTVKMDAAGSAATIVATDVDTAETGNVVLATVTVRGDEPGTTDLPLTVETLDTEAGQDYAVTEAVGSSVTVVGSTTPTPVTADAGANQTADEGDVVTLDASGSSGPDGSDLDYSWTQTNGTNVTLDAAANGTASFTAPTVDENTTLTFDVQVRHGDQTDTDTVTVFVRDTTATANETLPTSLNMTPASDELEEHDETTFDVVVENASGGVGAYNLTVAVADSDVASITDVQLRGTTDNSTSEVTMARDGSSATAVATNTDTNDTGRVVLATVTVEGDNDGETNLTLTVDSLTNEHGEHYTVTNATGSTLTVTENRYTGPADFQVSKLQPGDVTVTQGERIDASATIENIGGRTKTKVVELRVADTVVDSRDVTLTSGEQTTITFENVETRNIATGSYTYGIYTEDDSQTAVLTVDEVGDDAPRYTLDDIAQDKYGKSFAALDTETAGQVQAIHNRQPFLAGDTAADIETREEIANRLYGTTIDESELTTELTREQLIEVQNTYDAQFGPLPTDPRYTLDDIVHGKYSNHTFDDVSEETAGAIVGIYNRQPFADDMTSDELVHVKTHRELAYRMYGVNLEAHELSTELTREQYLAVQNAYDDQFTNE